MSKIIIIHDDGTTRQEVEKIEIPEGSDFLYYCFSPLQFQGTITMSHPMNCIYIPRPMKKVWKWYTHLNGFKIITDTWMDTPPTTSFLWTPMPDTEEEVDA